MMGTDTEPDLPSNSIIFKNADKEFLRITNNAVIVPEGVTPNESAEVLMQIVGEWVDNMVRTAILAERKECAKVVLCGTGEPVQSKTLEILRIERERIAAAIRARGLA